MVKQQAQFHQCWEWNPRIHGMHIHEYVFGTITLNEEASNQTCISASVVVPVAYENPRPLSPLHGRATIPTNYLIDCESAAYFSLDQHFLKSRLENLN